VRRRVFMNHFSGLAFLLLAAGCAGGGVWEPRRIDLPYPFEPSDVVWIWSGGRLEKWHAVVTTPDSVSGIPSSTSLECDSCRRSISRALVDSMKVGHPTRNLTVAQVGGVLAAGLLLEFVISRAVCAKNGC